MSSTSEVRTTILIISDTHSALPYPPDKTKKHSFQWPLPKADIVLHAGDLTMNGEFNQHKRALELLKGIDAPLKIVIPGNHDLTLDRQYYDKYPNEHCTWPKYDDSMLRQIEDLYTGKEACSNGIVYMVEGTRTFELQNGAKFTLYASAYQPEFCNWAFGYPREVDRYNPTDPLTSQLCTPSASMGASFPANQTSPQPENPIPDNVDIMLTHGPPKGVLDKVFPSGNKVGCDHLLRAVQRCKPRLHAFGHIHEACGAVRKTWSVESCTGNVGEQYASMERQAQIELDNIEQWDEGRMCAYYDATNLRPGRETLFVNASIMSYTYKPVQTPWLVDLMLPRVGES